MHVFCTFFVLIPFVLVAVFSSLAIAQEPPRTFRVPFHSVNNVFFWLLLGLAIAGAVWFLAGIVRVTRSEKFRVDVEGFRRDVDRLRKLRNERRSKRGKHFLLVGLLTVTLLLFSGLAFSGLAFAQEPPRTFRIPFHTAVNGLILLDGKINGRPASLLLDTGAGPNFATYEAAGLKPHEGIVESRHVEIAFGELRVTCPARIVRGLQSPKSDGTLGEDFLRRFSSVRIDFKNQVVELEQ